MICPKFQWVLSWSPNRDEVRTCSAVFPTLSSWAPFSKRIIWKIKNVRYRKKYFTWRKSDKRSLAISSTKFSFIERKISSLTENDGNTSNSNKSSQTRNHLLAWKAGLPAITTGWWTPSNGWIAKEQVKGYWGFAAEIDSRRTATANRARLAYAISSGSTYTRLTLLLIPFRNYRP